MRLMSAIRSLAGCALLMHAPTLLAQPPDCDCSQIIGSCAATYKLLNVYNDPQNINSKAELQITSSVAACSKVEYFINNTPYQTILANTNQAYESVFGTTAITSKTVQIQACKVCASTDRKADAPVNSPGASSAEQLFSDALGNSNFDAASYNQTLQNKAGSDSLLPAIGVAIEAASAVQQLQQGSAPAAAASGYQVGGSVYENRGGLIDTSAQAKADAAKAAERDRNTTKPASCATCGGVR
ncbi:hypothetical protein D3C76_938340 [compost metagenome]